MLSLAEVAKRFESARQQGAGFMARCPAHEDAKASLSISSGDGGKILLHCHAGCSFADIIKAAGLSMDDVSPQNGSHKNNGHNTNGKVAKKQVAIYVYQDENGKPLFRKIRYEPKAFSLQRSVGPEKWEYGIAGVRRVLYRLPRLIQADPEQYVYIVEGEKDVESAEKLGCLATCNFDGAAKSTESPKWREDYNEFLRGRHVVVIPDNDAAGRAHATAIAKSLIGIPASLRVLTLPGLPEGGDLSDWVSAGGTDEQLGELVESCPLWRPGDTPAATEEREPLPLTCRELYSQFPTLRPHVIHGLLRQGETMNCIAAPKLGKSWLAINAALCVVTGKRWLGTFGTAPGPVLIVDNELHHETIAHRIPKVAEALGIEFEQYADNLRVQSLRGQLRDINGLGKLLLNFEPGQFKLIILDAFYRCLPQGADENRNGDVAAIYNTIDSYADRLRCAFMLIHHSTKGNQSGKSTTDIGAGAGSQSRATDTHLVLRPHREPSVVVLEAVARSWPPIEPICLKWDFPVWSLAEHFNAADLLPERRTAAEARQERCDQELPGYVSKLRAALERHSKGETKSTLKSESGLRTPNLDAAIAAMLDAGQIEPCEVFKSGKKTPHQGYRLISVQESSRTPAGHQPDNQRPDGQSDGQSDALTVSEASGCLTGECRPGGQSDGRSVRLGRQTELSAFTEGATEF